MCACRDKPGKHGNEISGQKWINSKVYSLTVVKHRDLKFTILHELGNSTCMTMDEPNTKMVHAIVMLLTFVYSSNGWSSSRNFSTLAFASPDTSILNSSEKKQRKVDHSMRVSELVFERNWKISISSPFLQHYIRHSCRHSWGDDISWNFILLPLRILSPHFIVNLWQTLIN